MATLTGPSGGYYLNGWYTSTNAWGSSGLTYGTDYTITGTYDSTDITKGVSYTWNFGSLPNNGNYNVLAYPELCYGQDAWGTSIDPTEAPFPLKVSDITKFNASYNLSWGGQTQGYDVAFDMFLSSNPTGGSASIDNEVMVWIHTGGFNPGSPIASFNDSGVNGSLYTFWASGQGWQYSAFLTNSDMPSGTIDIAAILKQLASRGIVKSTDYVENIDIGAEVAAGAGTLTINNVGYDIQTTGSAETTIGTPNTTTTTPAAKITQRDFNGDGKGDELLAINGNTRIKVLLMNGETVSSSTDIAGPGTHWTNIHTGDFSGDGKSDIVWQNVSTGAIQVWTMNGGTKTASASLTSPGAAWQVVATGDTYGDGKSDLILENGSQVEIWRMSGSTIVSNTTVVSPVPSGCKLITTGDFYGDGKADILWQNTSTGALEIWHMNGAAVASDTVLSTNPGSSWRAVTTGDFNGDGKSDILLQNTSTGQTEIFFMNGSTVQSSGTVSKNLGAIWAACGSADYNGDGFSDILFRNTSSGQYEAFMMSGTSVLSSSVLSVNPGTGWHAVAG